MSTNREIGRSREDRVSSRLKAFLVSLAAVTVAVPATLVLAGNGNYASGPVTDQFVSWNATKEEAPKNWKPVPEGSVISTPGVLSVAVSAQMTKGKAKFRIVPEIGGAPITPGPVLFTAKAANSFTWVTHDTCGQGEQHVLQWKRVGKADAVAAKLSVHNLLDSFCI